jgi:hypothetical protein
MRREDLHKENKTNFLGANSAVYLNERLEGEYDSARVPDLGEVIISRKVGGQKRCNTDSFNIV